MTTNTQSTEGKDPLQTESESALRGAACSSLFSDTPETDAERHFAYGYESELGVGVDFDRDDEGSWVPVSTAQRLERERNDTRERYYGLKEYHETVVEKSQKLLDDLKGIASGLYSWQCCVDEIAPQAVADFYLENVKHIRR